MQEESCCLFLQLTRLQYATRGSKRKIYAREHGNIRDIRDGIVLTLQ